jgi:hypothetical protein
MIDREKVTNVLSRRFPTASPGDIAAAANAIVGLAHEYEPVAPESVGRFECAARQTRYTMKDLTSGRVRLFARVGS